MKNIAFSKVFLRRNNIKHIRNYKRSAPQKIIWKFAPVNILKNTCGASSIDLNKKNISKFG